MSETLYEVERIKVLSTFFIACIETRILNVLKKNCVWRIKGAADKSYVKLLRNAHEK